MQSLDKDHIDPETRTMIEDAAVQGFHAIRAICRMHDKTCDGCLFHIGMHDPLYGKTHCRIMAPDNMPPANWGDLPMQHIKTDGIHGITDVAQFYPKAFTMDRPAEKNQNDNP